LCIHNVRSIVFTLLEPTLPLQLQDVYSFGSLQVGLVYVATVVPSLFCERIAVNCPIFFSLLLELLSHAHYRVDFGQNWCRMGHCRMFGTLNAVVDCHDDPWPLGATHRKSRLGRSVIAMYPVESCLKVLDISRFLLILCCHPSHHRLGCLCKNVGWNRL